MAVCLCRLAFIGFDGLGAYTPTMTYTIGDDVLSLGSTSDVYHFGYDGHGSTRLLLKTDGTIEVSYAYDAYGNAEGFDPAAADIKTKYLYAGEQYDANLGMHYLRAHYYNAANATFNRMDPFQGDPFAPQSLHKYAYVHNNPVMNVDPTGLFFSLIGSLASAFLGRVLRGITALPALAAGVYMRAALAINIFLARIARFFWDPRTWDTITRGYWRVHNATGGRTLHHWLIPKRWDSFPEGLRNAGFNLLNMPGFRFLSLNVQQLGGLNQWMGFAVRWQGYRAVVAVIAERVLIPIAVIGTAAGSAYIGNEIGEKIIQLEGGATATPLRLTEAEIMEQQKAMRDQLDEEP